MSESWDPIAKSSLSTPETQHTYFCVPWIASKVRKTFPDALIYLDQVPDSHAYTFYCRKHDWETTVYIVKPHYDQAS